MLVAPGVAEDIEAVAVLGKAVNVGDGGPRRGSSARVEQWRTLCDIRIFSCRLVGGRLGVGGGGCSCLTTAEHRHQDTRCLW